MTKHKAPSEPVHLRVVVDITDTITIAPDSIETLRALNLHVNRNSASRVGVTVISDKELNPVEELVLPDQETALKNHPCDDVHCRDKEVQQFYSHILKAMRNIDTPADSTEALGHSEVLKTLAKQLQELKDDKRFTKKVLWVFSDLMENSALFNSYIKPMETKEERDSLKKLIADANILPDSLYGINVSFFYNPANRESDIKFNQIAGIVADLLREKGAIVIILASNKNVVYE